MKSTASEPGLSDQNSTSLLYLPIPSSAENLYEQAVSTFFALKLTFLARKIHILEGIFLQNKN